MGLSLGRRIGLISPIFEPSRGKWKLGELAKALNDLGIAELGDLDDQVLSKIFNGVMHVDRLEKSMGHPRIVKAVVSILDSEPGFWERCNTTAEEMSRALLGTASDFLHYVAGVQGKLERRQEGPRPAAPGAAAPADLADLPVLPSTTQVTRRDTQALYRKLGGRCFLYRFGVEQRHAPNKATPEFFPVLRRIPVEITDTNKCYLVYKDSYSLYQAEPEDDTAFGYAFYMKEHVTILAEDSDTRGGVSELFLIQLRETPLRGQGILGDIFEGLIVMNGDLRVPTACKVLFRRAPEDLQSGEWTAFAQHHQLKLDLVEDEGRFVPAAGTPAAEEFSGMTYLSYAHRLQFGTVGFDVALR